MLSLLVLFGFPLRLRQILYRRIHPNYLHEFTLVKKFALVDWPPKRTLSVDLSLFHLLAVVAELQVGKIIPTKFGLCLIVCPMLLRFLELIEKVSEVHLLW
jgi:hypothetical protein